MVSWWGGDGNPNDIVGTNHGTLVGDTTYAPGMVGQAFSLDGVNDLVSIPYSATLDLQGGFTVDAWVRPHGMGSGAVIAGQAYGSQLVMLPDGRVSISFHDGANWVATTSSSTLPLDVWSHVAGTLDSTGDVMTMYINGQPDAFVSTAALPAANPNNLEIGGFVCCGAFFSGLIDEVEIFNRALSAEEIAAIANAGSAGKCQTTDTIGPDLTGAWDPVTQSCKPHGKCTLRGSFRIWNQGTAPAPAFQVQVLLSDDAVPGGGDTVLKEKEMKALLPGQSRTKALHVPLPLGVNGSGKYVILKIDPLNVIPETLETNNTPWYEVP